MNFPIEIGVGNFKVSLHLLCELLGYSLGFRLYLFSRSKQKDYISDNNQLLILIGATSGALIFSRLLGSFENPNLWSSAPSKLLYFFQCKTIVGGLLGGLFGVEIVKKIIGETRSSGDLMVVPILLAMLIGRIGCFSQGIYEPTFGIVSNFPFAMDLGDGLMRHPTALYEVVVLFSSLLFFKFFKIDQKVKDGLFFKLFLISYLIWRLAIEELKPHYEYNLGLSAIQIACILGLLYYSKTIFAILFNVKSLQKND